EIKAVVYLVGQTAYLQRVSDILTAQGQAHDAYEEIMEWVQTNKTNAFLLNTAMADSLHAATLLRDDWALYYRPGTNPHEGDIFDHRSAPPAYAYAFGVRLAVLAIGQPDFISLAAIRQEYTEHEQWLNTLLSKMTASIQCTNAEAPMMPSSEPSTSAHRVTI